MSFALRQVNRLDLVAEERLYLNASRTKVVKEGDPEAAILLAPAGGVIPAFLAEKLGLKAQDSTPAPAPVQVPSEDPKSRSTRVIKPETR